MTDKRMPDTPPSHDVSFQTLPPFVAGEYLHHLEGLDISEEQKHEFLKTLWWIMAAFVDMGFDVKAVPAFIPDMGKLSSEFTENVVQNEDTTLAREFDGAALDGAESEGQDAEQD